MIAPMARWLPLVLLAATAARAGGPAQAPHAPWRTIQTAHYRVHYPASPAAGFEPFAREVASRVEEIHAAVVKEVGFEAKGPVQVLVRDPVGEANGLAYPLLSGPWIEVWRTPPESDSALSEAPSWADLVVTHELAHVHHLARPRVRPTLVERILALPAGPIALVAPRWVTEGYATVVEGRVTGGGRPFGAYRAAVLRSWALAGRLPDYGALSRTGGYRGGGMAYLVGSAYLEWLERRSGDPDSLRTLWKRLVSPKRRGFEKSFRATFGEGPRDRYDRFRAEVTRDALELERAMREAGVVEGEPWAAFDGDVADLSVSPDGGRLLARVSTPKAPGLRVYLLGEEGAGPDGAEEEVPDEPPDVPPPVPKREPRFTLGRIDGSLPHRASWLGAERVQFFLKRPDAEGVLVRRPYVWRPGEGFSPATEPAGARGGPIPVERRGGAFVARLAEGEVELPFEPVGPVRLDASGESLLGAAAVDGIWNLVRAPLERTGGGLRAGPVRALTRTVTAAWNPAPSPDGRSLFFTRLTARGTEIRRLALPAEAASTQAPEVPRPMTTGTVLSLPPGQGALGERAEPPPSRPYDVLGSTKVSSRSAATVTPSGTSYEAGVGGSDLLGRFPWQALVALGDAAGPRGAAVAAAWRGFRLAPTLTAFTVLVRPSAQRFEPVDGFDRSRTGAGLSFRAEGLGTTRWWVSPHAGVEHVGFAEGDEPSRTRALLGVSAEAGREWSRGEAWGLALSAGGTAQAGVTSGESWQLLRASVRVTVRTPLLPLTASSEAGTLGGDPSSLDRFFLGGTTGSLVPPELDASRVAQSALPSYLATGDRLLGLRFQAGQAVRVYLEEVAVWDGRDARPPFTRVAGFEVELDVLSVMPAVAWRVGRLSLVAGVHRPLDGPMEGRTVATLVATVRP